MMRYIHSLAVESSTTTEEVVKLVRLLMTWRAVGSCQSTSKVVPPMYYRHDLA
jgi:hypothetical protein